jgi:hypothetical protein
MLFDGTLGDWNQPPISIELKEGAKPYHRKPYPIPQIHKATLMKEINRLVSMRNEEVIVITMGLSNMYNTKKRYDSSDHI